jgi:hypothetical protein
LSPQHSFEEAILYSIKTIGELRAAEKSLAKASSKDSDAVQSLRNVVADHNEAGEAFEVVVCSQVAALCTTKAGNAADSPLTTTPIKEANTNGDV